MTDLSPSMDMSTEMLGEMWAVAEAVDGNLAVTREGRLVVSLPQSSDPADVVAERVSDIFTFGFVEAGDDSTLVFAF